MLVFDIETGPLPETKLRELMPPCEMPPHPGEFDPASVKLGQMKDQTKIEAKIADAKTKHETAVANYEKDAAEKQAAHETAFFEKAALNAGTGQVLAIGYLGLAANFKKIAVNENPADDDCERALLREFWDITSDVGFQKKNRLAGHFSNRFDLPFLVQRSFILQVPVPPEMVAGRYWPDCFVDTCELWLRGTGERFIKLDVLCRLLGVPGKNGNGADFARLFREDRKAAVNYLKTDLIATHGAAERLGVR